MSKYEYTSDGEAVILYLLKCVISTKIFKLYLNIK